MNPKEKYVTVPMDVFMQMWRVIGRCEGIIPRVHESPYNELIKQLEQTMEAAFRAASEE